MYITGLSYRKVRASAQQACDENIFMVRIWTLCITVCKQNAGSHCKILTVMSVRRQLVPIAKMGRVTQLIVSGKTRHTASLLFSAFKHKEYKVSITGDKTHDLLSYFWLC